MSDRILLVDDDKVLSSMTSEYLNSKGFDTDLCYDADSGFRQFSQGEYSLCILDVSMPFKDGFTLAEEIRAVNPGVPIIFLTGNTGKDDRIKGLSLGADDYVTKPFSMEELYLRVRNILRRTERLTEAAVFNLGIFHFNATIRELVISDEVQKLTEAESRLLKLFCTEPDGFVTRDVALQKVWNDSDHLKSRSLNVYINKLRKRLEADGRIEILNVYGSGYQLVVKKND